MLPCYRFFTSTSSTFSSFDDNYLYGTKAVCFQCCDEGEDGSVAKGTLDGCRCCCSCCEEVEAERAGEG